MRDSGITKASRDAVARTQNQAERMRISTVRAEVRAATAYYKKEGAVPIYLQKGATLNKARDIMARYPETKMISGPAAAGALIGSPAWVPVCVVLGGDGQFEDAAILYCKQEWMRYANATDTRPKKWLSMRRTDASDASAEYRRYLSTLKKRR